MILRAIKFTGLIAAFFFAVGIGAYFTITLIIKSEDTVVIPELTGKELVYSLELLTDLDLNTKVKGSEYSTDIPKNHIIFQDPEPGAEIKKGRDVKIIISKGTRTVSMPNLEGLSSQQARIIIEENGLCLGARSTIHDKFQKNEILAQVPAPGTLIARGRCVDLLSSSGDRSNAYMMPDLSGIALDDAISLIEGHHLLLGEIKSIFHRYKQKNIIVSQEPLSGHRVLEGSIVNLTINRLPNEKESARLNPAGGIKLFRHRLEKGFLRKRIRIRVNCFGVLNEVFNEFIKPGEEVWTLIASHRDATLFLYEDNELVETRVYDAWQ